MHLLYSFHMRTTISLDDRLAEEVQRRAAARGQSVSSFIASILDDTLKRHEPEEERSFRLITVGDEGVFEGINLDHPRRLEIEEDERSWRAKLDQ